MQRPTISSQSATSVQCVLWQPRTPAQQQLRLDTCNKSKTRSLATFAIALTAGMLVASWWTLLTRIKVVCFVWLSAPFAAHTQAPVDGWIAAWTDGLVEKCFDVQLVAFVRAGYLATGCRYAVKRSYNSWPASALRLPHRLWSVCCQRNV